MGKLIAGGVILIPGYAVTVQWVSEQIQRQGCHLTEYGERGFIYDNQRVL